MPQLDLGDKVLTSEVPMNPWVHIFTVSQEAVATVELEGDMK